MSILTCFRQVLTLNPMMRHLNEHSNLWKDSLHTLLRFIIILQGKKLFVKGRVMYGHVCMVKHKNMVDKVSSSESPWRTWKSSIMSYSLVLTVDLIANNYNLGQNKMEQQTPSPPNQGWSRAKRKNAPFSHLWFGGEGRSRFSIYFVQDCSFGDSLRFM